MASLCNASIAMSACCVKQPLPPSSTLRCQSTLSASHSYSTTTSFVRRGTEVSSAGDLAQRMARLQVSAAQAVDASTGDKSAKKRVGKPVFRKQRLLLKFVWLEKNIGIALDQQVPGGTVPVTEYMFWPRKDAWEQLKEKLEQKPWISRKKTVVLLNQATDIINLWQQSTFRPN
eukprot:TRINITY_DN20778_c0_g1_i1.p1 TRINITY_DN20778_c0_g1~~TRINITY_DN20778_c0_g1_i1.p1  ORF type:complete len:201 (-),score=37.02 TRINITY_DN20778_c0_g1_i1:349-870(-)